MYISIGYIDILYYSSWFHDHIRLIYLKFVVYCLELMNCSGHEGSFSIKEPTYTMSHQTRGYIYMLYDGGYE